MLSNITSFAARLGESTAAFETGLVQQFAWESSTCSEGYDFCGDLEFCSNGDSGYGFRLPGDEDCSFPGPTIRMRPGARYELVLHHGANPLGAGAIVNVHTHGLHIAGAGNTDDVTRELHAGQCMTYNWDLSDNHMPGTYWYHAHHHGVTNPQVSGGAFGMLIVEDTEQSARQLLPDDMEPWEREGILAWMQNDIALQLSRLGTERHANGVPDAQIKLVEAEWYRLRLSFVDPTPLERSLEFVGEEHGQAGGACELHRVAHDGVYRTIVPEPAETAKLSVGGASRLDLAVRCKQGTLAIVYDGVRVGSITAIPGQVTLAQPFRASGEPWRVVKPRYLRDLTGVQASSNMTISLGRNQINQRSWDMRTPLFTVEYGEVHELTIQGSGSHPFHLHLYHYQVISPEGCGTHEYGEHYDVIQSPTPCRVRFWAIDIGQRCVMHCHRLAHEDAGMMSWLDVQGPDMPLAPTDNAAQHQCGERMTAKLAAARSNNGTD